jgi:hypothetical protein
MQALFTEFLETVGQLAGRLGTATILRLRGDLGVCSMLAWGCSCVSSWRMSGLGFSPCQVGAWVCLAGNAEVVAAGLRAGCGLKRSNARANNVVTEYWLWCGVGAIDDLDDCADFALALEALAEWAGQGRDVTLWMRDDGSNKCRALLLAVATAGCQPLVLRYPIGQLVALDRLKVGQVLRVVRGHECGRVGRIVQAPKVPLGKRGLYLMDERGWFIVCAENVMPEPAGCQPPDDKVPAAAPGTCK